MTRLHELACAAYRNPNQPLPTTAKRTPEQAFFIAFAQVYCAAESSEYLAHVVPIDPHSPSKYRVDETVRSIPSFATAFHCAAGAPLAPVDGERCELW